ncbi:MAG: carboxypeptidase-like regulatory domain-containing protein [Chloroflexi bacterium]|nr:carboxypeptidase-like regulatory domain-containing protein [Chloroflexota bacterium]
MTGTIVGRALAGPTCPVAKLPPDPACADRPVGGAVVMVSGPDGATVATAVTGADGTFALTVTPGAYTLLPQPVEGLMGVAPPTTVTVEAGATARVDLLYDTGIR